MEYHYDDASGNLTSVDYPDGESVNYTYSTGAVVLTDVDNYKVKLNMNGIRVTKVQEFYGNEERHNVVITHNNSFQNTFVDSKGTTIVKQFDRFGRTITVMDGDGNYVSNGYASANRITGVRERGVLLGGSGSGFSSINLLKNHSFEYNDSWTATAWGGATATSNNLASVATAYAGVRSAQLSNDTDFTANGSVYVYQSVPDTLWSAGQEITLSGYAKVTQEVIKCTNNTNTESGAMLYLSFRNSSGNLILEPKGVFDSYANTDWQRKSVTAVIPEGTTDFRVGIMLNNAKGDIYFDALQLEKSNSSSVYNYAEDGDFTANTPIPSIVSQTLTATFSFTKNLADLGQTTVSSTGSGEHTGTINASLVEANANYKLLGTSSHETTVKYTGLKSAVEAYLTTNYPGWNNHTYSVNASLRLRAHVDNSAASVSGVNKAWYWMEGSSASEIYYASNGASSNGDHNIDRANIVAWSKEQNPANLFVRVESQRNVATQTGYRRTSFGPNNGSSYITFSGTVTYPNPNYVPPHTSSSPSLTGNNATHTTQANTATNFRDSRLDNKALKLTGNQNQQSRATVEVPISGKIGDTYLIGVWAKPENALPLNIEQYQRSFSAYVNGGNGTNMVKIEQSDLPFNPLNPSWQYLQTVVTLTSNTQYLDVVFTYDNQRGAAYFDGLQVQKFDVGAQKGAESQPIIDSTVPVVPSEVELGENHIANNSLRDNLGREIATRKSNGEVVMYSFSEYDAHGNVSKSVGSDGSGVNFERDHYAQLDRSYTNGTSAELSELGLNLLENVGFEASLYQLVNDEEIEVPGIADCWTHSSNPSTDALILRNPTAKKSGNFGYTLSRTSSGLASIEQVFSGIVSGEEYKLSAWVKVPSGTINGSGVTLKIEEIETIDSAAFVDYSVSTEKINGDWQLLNVNYTVSENGGNFLRIKIQLNGIGMAYVDDVQLDVILKNEGLAQAITQPVTFNYTALGILNQVRQAVAGLSNGNYLQTDYTYQYGRLKSIQHNGFAYNVEYDLYGRQTAIKVKNSDFLSYSYPNDDSATPNAIHYANGQTVSYVYDEGIGAITGVSVSGDASPEFIYSYDENGHLISYTDTIAQTVTTLTETGTEIKSSVDASPIYSVANDTETYLGQAYTHKQQNLIPYEDLTAAEKAVREEEARKNINTSIIKTTGSVDFTNTQKVDFFGRVMSNQVQDGNLLLTDSFEYLVLSGNRATEYVAALRKQVGDEVVSTFNYAYDTKGNITEIRDGNNNLLSSYVYDAAGQFISETTPEGTTTWQYDVGGNIASKTLPDGSVVNYTYDVTWKDKLVGYGGQGISYDQIGNPTAFSGNTLTWNGKQMTGFNGLIFSYDINGMRTKKTVNGSTINYVWNDKRLVGQSDGVNTLYFLYEKTDGELGFVLNGEEVYWYLKNLQGDIIGLLDSNGTIVARYAYDAWGAPIPVEQDENYLAEIAELNPLRYRGYYYDGDISDGGTGLYYCQSRYYNPQWGRWLNLDEPTVAIAVSDSVHAGNLFEYCENNPIAKTDWSGYLSGSLFGFIKYNISFNDISIDFTANDLRDFLFGVGDKVRNAMQALTLYLKMDSGAKDKFEERFSGISNLFQYINYGIVDVVDFIDVLTENNEFFTRIATGLGCALYGIGTNIVPTAFANDIPGLLKGVFDGIRGGIEYGLVGYAFGGFLKDGVKFTDIFTNVLTELMDFVYNEKLIFSESIKNILDAVGYSWDGEVWFTKANDNWLERPWYHEIYNTVAPAVWFFIDDLQVIFNPKGITHLDGNYCIWLWKGNYGPITIGGEIGFYKEIIIHLQELLNSDNAVDFLVDLGISINNAIKYLKNLIGLAKDGQESVFWYDPVDQDNKMIEMKMAILNRKSYQNYYDELFERDEWTKHWWMTAFKLHIRSRDEKFVMVGGLRFKDKKFNEAFMFKAEEKGLIVFEDFDNDKKVSYFIWGLEI
jgi:RHS repeat-associated protein